MDLKEIALNKSNRRHPWELARIKVIASLLDKYIDHGKQLHVLDVGSGDIYLIKQLAQQFKSARFYAVDIGYTDEYLKTENAQLAAEEFNIILFNNLSQATIARSGNIDLVLLLDVVEHVPDDKYLLEELRTLMSIDASTLFLITVPAFQYLFCSHDVFLGHYRRYNNVTLRKVIRASGLDALQVGYFFFSLLLPRLISVTIEKISGEKKNPSGIGNWNGGDAMSKVFVNTLLLDFTLGAALKKLGINVPGLSNYALCRKSN